MRCDGALALASFGYLPRSRVLQTVKSEAYGSLAEGLTSLLFEALNGFPQGYRLTEPPTCTNAIQQGVVR